MLTPTRAPFVVYSDSQGNPAEAAAPASTASRDIPIIEPANGRSADEADSQSHSTPSVDPTITNAEASPSGDATTESAPEITQESPEVEEVLQPAELATPVHVPTTIESEVSSSDVCARHTQ